VHGNQPFREESCWGHSPVPVVEMLPPQEIPNYQPDIGARKSTRKRPSRASSHTRLVGRERPGGVFPASPVLSSEGTASFWPHPEVPLFPPSSDLTPTASCCPGLELRSRAGTSFSRVLLPGCSVAFSCSHLGAHPVSSLGPHSPRRGQCWGHRRKTFLVPRVEAGRGGETRVSCWPCLPPKCLVPMTIFPVFHSPRGVPAPCLHSKSIG
jgi:hypothetical protein